MTTQNAWSDLLDKVVVAIILAILVLVPATFSASFVPSNLPMAVYGSAMLMLLLLWGVKAQGSGGLAKIRAALVSGPNPAILAYVAWSVASLAYSIAPGRSLATVLQLGFGALLYFLIVYQMRRPMQMRALLAGIMALGVLLVFGAFLLDSERQWRDLSGSFQDRQLFGAFLSVILPVLIGVAFGSKDRKTKLGAQVAALLVAAALVLTQCRSSWIGALVGLAALLVLGFRYVWGIHKLAARKHESLVTPLLAIVVLALFLGVSRMGAPVLFRASTLTNAQSDPSVVDRLDLWKTAGKLISERPVFGWGVGAYAFAQAPLRSQSRPVEAIAVTGPSLGENPHNSYLQIGAELGGVGLALYLLILGLFFLTGLKALPRLEGGLRQGVLIGALAALAGQSVDALANPGWSFPQVSLFLWVVLGLGMSSAGLGDTIPDNSTREERKAPAMVRGLRVALVTLAVIVIGSQMLNVNLSNPAFAKNVATYPSNNTCPLSHGYWKNHPAKWPVSTLVLGNKTYSSTELMALLKASSAGDASVILAHQLIAAKLNIANNSLATPVASAIFAADLKLASYSPPKNKLPYQVKPTSPDGMLMMGWGTTLDNYNNNKLTPGCRS